MTASAFDPHGQRAQGWSAPAGWLQSNGCRLSPYLPIEPLLVNRHVLDMGGPEAATARIERAGARSVHRVDAPAWQLPWPVASGGVDVVLALGEWRVPELACLQEARRVLSPGGFVIFRFVVEEGFSQATLVEQLRQVYETVDVMSQVPLAGFSFDRVGSSAIVVAEDLFQGGAAPSHVLALCGVGVDRPWKDLESWMVPLARPSLNASDVPASTFGAEQRLELEQQLKELSHEREYLREMVMTLQDERDRLSRLATNLRRDADRGLARLSEQAAALEVLSLERDHALRRAASMEVSDRTDSASQVKENPLKPRPTSA